MDKRKTVSSRVPDDVYRQLKMILFNEGMTFTRWLTTQMQRTLDEYGQMKGDDHE